MAMIISYTRTFCTFLAVEILLSCRHVYAISTNLTPVEIEEMLAAHNMYRRKVHPRASNMRLMTWDDSIASIAQDKAEQCIYSHGVSVFHPTYGKLGENIYIIEGRMPSGVDRAVTMWNDEVNYYSHEHNTCQAGHKCGHYTQLVWAKSSMVGCGMNYCPGTVDVPERGVVTGATMIFCHYAATGNVQEGFLFKQRTGRPYKSGQWCSKCPHDAPVCSNKLCIERMTAGSGEATSPATVYTTPSGGMSNNRLKPAVQTVPLEKRKSVLVTVNAPTMAEDSAIAKLDKTTDYSTLTTNFTSKPADNNLAITPVTTRRPVKKETVSDVQSTTWILTKTVKDQEKAEPLTTRPGKRNSTDATKVSDTTNLFSSHFSCYSCPSTYSINNCRKSNKVVNCSSHGGATVKRKACMTIMTNSQVEQRCTSEGTCKRIKSFTEERSKGIVNCCATHLCNRLPNPKTKSEQVEYNERPKLLPLLPTTAATAGGSAQVTKPTVLLLILIVFVECAVLS